MHAWIHEIPFGALALLDKLLTIFFSSLAIVALVNYMTAAT